MPIANPEAMTIDELDAESVRLKRLIEPLRDERRALKAVRDRKVRIEALARKLGIDVDGISPEDADALLRIAGETPPRPGDVVVAPAPGQLDMGAVAPEVK